MKLVSLAVPAVLLAGSASAQQPPMPTLTPAQERIAAAEKALGHKPDVPGPRAELALALARRARETADPEYYRKADEVLDEALRRFPGDYEARRARVWVRLGQHEFAKALDEARELNRKSPDDLLVYGFLGDAYVELGRYAEAEEALQWMLNLRPGNVPGLTRAAHLRELFGDVGGALDFMRQALDRTPPEEDEDRAWILTQIGHLHLSAGRIVPAEQALDEAVELFPGYHYALAGLAKVRTAEGRHAEAAGMLQRRFEAAPHPENLLDVARALRAAGRGDEARQAFAEFEARARAEMEKPDNCNRELASYYVDDAKKPAEALRVAELEIARRRDVHTLDALAWALQASGRADEARRAIDEALAVGVRDARLLYHAGIIATRAGDRIAARRYLEQSLQASPVSEVAADARLRLRKLG